MGLENGEGGGNGGGGGGGGAANGAASSLGFQLAEATSTGLSPLAPSPVPAGDGGGGGGGGGEGGGEVKRRVSNTDGKEEGGGKKKTRAVPFLSLFRFADRLDMLLMFVGAFSALVVGAGMPALSLFFGNLLDAFGGNAGDRGAVRKAVATVSLRFVYLGIATFVFGFLQTTCWMTTAERQANRIRVLYLKAVLSQDVAFFDTETSTGAVVASMSGDTFLVQEAIGEKVGQFIQFMTTFFGGFVIAFVRGWLMTLVMLATLPALAVAGGLVAYAIKGYSARGQASYSEAGTVVEEVLSAIRTVAAFVGEEKAVAEYNSKLRTAYRAAVKQGVATALALGTMTLIMFSSYALALWYGSRLILKDEGYTGGRVLTVLFGVLIGGMSLGQATPNLGAFASGAAAAYNLFSTIKRKPAINSMDPSGLRPESVQGALELRNVQFAYPARPDVTIFEDFSLVVPPGKTVALVGESGSGKSTVVALLERFYDPLAGEVLFDGVDIRKLNLKWFRSQVGLVSQEPVLFATSIFENMSYGHEGATLEDMRAAANMANIDKFIMSLPEGYNTQVGERGTQLSGGQKQRIAIARAIMKDPKVLLLDEATSALDAESEKVVQHALETVSVSRTTVVIAHRLTTIRTADVIAVVQRGRVVEKGTYGDLLHNPDGAFSQLVKLQQNNKEEEADGAPLSPDATAGAMAVAVLAHVSDLGQGSGLGPSEAGADGPLKAGGEGTSGAASLDAEAQKKKSWWRRQKGVSKKKLLSASEAPKEEEVPLSRLVGLNKPEWPVLFVGTIASAAHGLAFPIFSVLLSKIIKTLYLTDPHELRTQANKWSLGFLLLGLSSLVAIVLAGLCFNYAGANLVRRVRAYVFAAVLRQEVAYFDEAQNTSGAIGARLAKEAEQVRAIVGDRLNLLVQNTSTVVAGLAIAFSSCWELTLLVLALVPLLAVGASMQVSAVKGLAADAKSEYEAASGVANGAISSIRTVASFCAEERVVELYEEKCAVPLKAGVRQAQVSGFFFGFAFLSLFCNYGLCFWVGSILVEKGRATFEQVFRVFFAIVFMAMGAAQSSALLPDVVKVKEAVKSVFHTIDRKPKIERDDPNGLTMRESEFKGSLELVDVHFAYPARPLIPIFRGFSLKVTPGQATALVGESGSGKSTVIALVERFYDPSSGVVMVDGTDIRKLRLSWLRSQISLVSQEPSLFDMTIRDNIRYGRANATDAEIEAAARTANAYNFVSSLPDGFNTQVGERGIQLSGGQKQRIAIARAMVRDPKILLLDEATSALDAESEHVVQEALDKAMVNRTTIVVAHRLSTIKNVHEIAVVRKGKIIESGTHAGLLEVPGGAYASLVRLNMLST